MPLNLKPRHSSAETVYQVGLSVRLVIAWATITLSVAVADHLMADAAAADAAVVPQAATAFLKAHCLDCHQGQTAEAALDLSTMRSLTSADQLARWVRIVDRVAAGEMPPKDVARPPQTATTAFVDEVSHWLRDYQSRQIAVEGRVRGRRLTKLQLERTLHDLLGIDIPLADKLPDEPRTAGFTTVADGQAMSHFQLERHLAVVDVALDEAFRRATSEPDEMQRSMTADEIARRDRRRRCREPEMIDDHAVVWASRLIFYGRLPATTAKADGWYRFTIKASALKQPDDRGVWCTVRSGPCVSSAPMLGWVGALEATPEPQEWTFETWLPKGQMLEIRPGDTTLKMARFAGGQVGVGEGDPQDVPGVALHGLSMERFHQGPNNDQIREWLIGDVQLQDGRRGSDPQLLSEDAASDAARLIDGFARRAFRRPVPESEIVPFVAMAHRALENGESLMDAVRGSYRAILCSPRFLYFLEEPGPLDDFAVASRLSYFLWNTMPDAQLMQLAAAGSLTRTEVLREQVDRLLSDPRGQQFVRDFAAEWLDLSLIDFTEPDPKLFPRFDVIVQQSMLEETHTYLQTLVSQNLSVDHLVHSDFTFLNSRLARFYELDGVRGDELQQVSLKPEDHRGGLLTQGAILKVTANGTTTSPVIRGVWVNERLLGEEIPSPPESVPAIEPDIRGATSIREMLEKHRSDTSCASCHVKIDPPGFALENFDPAGQWRTSYGRSGGDKKSRGVPVDASYQLADGRSFQNIDDFRKLILSDVDSLTRNLAEKLLTYGTGAPIAFADRQTVEQIVEQSAKQGYGVRSVIQNVVTSSIFTNK